MKPIYPKTKAFALAVLGLGFYVAPLASPGQSVPPDLKALITKAVDGSHRVRQAILQEKISRMNTADAQSSLKPTVAFGANYTYLNPVSKATLPVGGGSREVQFVPYHNWGTQVSISQTVLDFGRTKTAVETALEQEAQAKITTESFKHTLTYQVAQVYYGLVFLQQSIAVQDSLLASLQENARTVEARLLQGEAIDLDRLNARSLIDQTQTRRTDLLNQLQRQQASLRFLVGEAANVAQTAKFDFKLADTTGLVAGKQNLDLALAKAKVRAAERVQTQRQRLYYPTLVAQGSAGVKNGYLPIISDPKPNVSAGLVLNVPIYAGGRTERAQQIAQAQAAAAQEDLDQAQSTYARDLAFAQADRDGALIKLKNAASQVAQAARGRQIAQSRYKNGSATQLDVYTSNDLFQQARLSQVQAQYQLTLAELEIARLAGASL